jgi:hypothetical protein
MAEGVVVALEAVEVEHGQRGRRRRLRDRGAQLGQQAPAVGQAGQLVGLRGLAQPVDQQVHACAHVGHDPAHDHQRRHEHEPADDREVAPGRGQGRRVAAGGQRALRDDPAPVLEERRLHRQPEIEEGERALRIVAHDHQRGHDRDPQILGQLPEPRRVPRSADQHHRDHDPGDRVEDEEAGPRVRIGPPGENDGQEHGGATEPYGRHHPRHQRGVVKSALPAEAIL